MRLSPKSVFFGLLALGLPFAMTVGWNLASPGRTHTEISLPGGAGGLGSAPVSGSTPTPDTVIRWVTPSLAWPPPATPSAPLPAVAPSRPASAPPSAPASAQPESPPALTDPPVPTPTMITIPPALPTATPTTAPPPPEPSPTDPQLIPAP